MITWLRRAAGFPTGRDTRIVMVRNPVNGKSPLLPGIALAPHGFSFTFLHAVIHPAP